MKIMKSALYSSLILSMFLILTHLLFIQSFGTPITEWTAVGDDINEVYELKKVYYSDGEEVLIVDFYSEFDKPEYDDVSVVLQLPDTMSFEVYVNDVMIGKIGDPDNPDTYSRNHVYVFPIDSGHLFETGNTIQIRTGELDSTMLDFYPELMEFDSAMNISGFKNFLLNELYLLVIVLIIVINIALAHNAIRQKNFRVLLSGVIAITTLIAIYSLQFYYYPSNFLILNFFIIKKIANISGPLFIMITFRLFDYYQGEPKKRNYLFVDIPALVVILLIVFATDYVALRTPIFISVVFMAIYLGLTIFMVFKKRVYDLLPVLITVVITSAELILSFLYVINNLYLIHYGVAAIVINIYILSYSYFKKAFEMNYIDDLTKSFNRKHLDRVTCDENTRFVFIDLDDFKKYNDLHGHPKGDELLIWLVNLIKSYDEFSNNVIRFGGDEFILISRNVSMERLDEIMNEIETKLKDETQFVGLSYGIELYLGNIDESIQSADKNMYTVKMKKKG